jgi:hypothetical protein
MSKNQPVVPTSEIVRRDSMLAGDDSGKIEIFSPEDFTALGFSEERTIKIGDPSLGGIAAYIGQLIGPGVDIDVVNNSTGEVGAIKTWQAHPLNLKTRQINTSITDRVISPHNLNQSWERIFKTATAQNKHAISGAVWTGKIPLEGGKKMMNTFRIFEIYLAPGEKLTAISNAT